MYTSYYDHKLFLWIRFYGKIIRTKCSCNYFNKFLNYGQIMVFTGAANKWLVVIDCSKLFSHQ